MTHESEQQTSSSSQLVVSCVSLEATRTTDFNNKSVIISTRDDFCPLQIQIIDNSAVASTRDKREKNQKVVNRTSKKIETRVQRSVVLEDGKIIADTGPQVITRTLEDVVTENAENEGKHPKNDDSDDDDQWESEDDETDIDDEVYNNEYLQEEQTGQSNQIKSSRRRRVKHGKEYDEDKKGENYVSLTSFPIVRRVNHIRRTRKRASREVSHYHDESLRDVTDPEEVQRALASPETFLHPIDNEFPADITGKLRFYSRMSKKIKEKDKVSEVSHLDPEGNLRINTTRSRAIEEVSDEELPESYVINRFNGDGDDFHGDNDDGDNDSRRRLYSPSFPLHRHLDHYYFGHDDGRLSSQSLEKKKKRHQSNNELTGKEIALLHENRPRLLSSASDFFVPSFSFPSRNDWKTVNIVVEPETKTTMTSTHKKSFYDSNNNDSNNKDRNLSPQAVTTESKGSLSRRSLSNVSLGSIGRQKNDNTSSSGDRVVKNKKDCCCDWNKKMPPRSSSSLGFHGSTGLNERKGYKKRQTSTSGARSLTRNETSPQPTSKTTGTFVTPDFRERLKQAHDKLRSTEKPAQNGSRWSFVSLDDITAASDTASVTTTGRRSAERRQRGIFLDGYDCCPPPPLPEPEEVTVSSPVLEEEDDKKDEEAEIEPIYGKLWKSRTGKPTARTPSPSKSSETFTRRRATRIAQLLRGRSSPNSKYNENKTSKLRQQLHSNKATRS